MKRFVTAIFVTTSGIFTGCVYHYKAAITFTPQPFESSVRQIELQSAVAGAASRVVTKVDVDASLQRFVDDGARAAGYSSGVFESIIVTSSKKEGEKETIGVTVRVTDKQGEQSGRAGSFVLIGSWIRQTKLMQGLTVDSTGVDVEPRRGSFREFAVSDAAVLRSAIIMAVGRALEEKTEPNQASEPTAPSRHGPP